MDTTVSAITGISRATRPVSSDTQIAVRQRRLEALDKQRAEAASSSDQTASYRLQALTQQIGLLQTQIVQLQQSASAAASRDVAGTTAAEQDDEAQDTDSRPTSGKAPGWRLSLASAADGDEAEADSSAQSLQARQADEARAARRDAEAVARARAQGSLIGSNVDTYA